MGGNKDFIEILREIRGTAVPGEPVTDGIWYELTIADIDGNPGIYGDILAKYGIVTESAGTFDQAVAILENLNVVVTTLPAGTEATSALVAGVWQLGIPRGTAGPQGPQGIQGIQGIQGVHGVQGETGPQGAQGLKGDTGDTGPQGIQGETGLTGPQGLKGDTGAALTIRGTDTAANILLKTPTLGDFWVASDTGDGYAGNGSSWVNTGPIRGPQGLQGVQGEVGPKGATGPQGPQGPQGASITDVISSKVGKTTTVDVYIENALVESFTVLDGTDGTGSGDMSKSVYDTNNNGIVDLAEGVNLDTTNVISPTTGQIRWNQDERTADVGLNGVTLQLGQEMLMYVRNVSGSTITNKTVCMASGTIGASGRITVVPFDIVDAKFMIGMATEDIPNGADGYITVFGKVRNIPTNAWANGDVLYATTSGGLTNISPTTGLNLPVAFVVNSHATNGTLFVRFDNIDRNRYQLADADLTAIAALTGTSGLLKKTAANTWTLDTTAYTTNLGTVTAVSGTAPIVSSGGTTPAISISAATTSLPGSMSATDKAKLDGIDAGAQVNVATDLSLGTITATNIPINSSTGTDVSLPVATTSLAGLLSATDKTKLNSIATDANNYVHPTTDGSLHVPATGTTNNGKVLTAGATAGSFSWQTVAAGVTDHTLLSNVGTNTHAQIDTALAKLNGIAAGAEVNVNSDWNAVSGDAQILNKPVLATVATSGSYADLSNTPTIDSAPTNGSTNAVSSDGVFDALALKAPLVSPTFTTPNIGVASGTSFNSITALASVVPVVAGTAAVGTSTTVARADHVHPRDSSKLDKSGGVLTGALTAVRETKVAMDANNIDLSTGNVFTKTITTTTTLTVSNVLASGNANSFILELTNGGAYAITWWPGMKWAGGTAPILTASGVDILGFYSHDGGTTWRGMLLSKDSK